MGRFHRLGKPVAFAFQYSQSRDRGRFLAPLEHPLHADAYAEEWHAALDRVCNSLLQARTFKRPCRCEVPDSWKHHLGRLGNVRWIRHNRALLLQAVKSFLHRDQIARTVIDDGNHTSTPLVLGSSLSICGSRQQAARSARANALKSASIL